MNDRRADCRAKSKGCRISVILELRVNFFSIFFRECVFFFGIVTITSVILLHETHRTDNAQCIFQSLKSCRSNLDEIVYAIVCATLIFHLLLLTRQF